MSHLFRVVNQGEEDLLDLFLAVNYTLRLYTNDVTAGLSDAQIDQLVQTDFVEATFAGYTAKALTGGAWTTSQGNPSAGIYTAQTFTRSSTGTPETVRGYYMTRMSDGKLEWFEQFDGPVVVEFINDAVVIVPSITLDDAGGNAMQTGVITAFGGATAPDGYLLCNGAAVSRTTYAALFAVVGTAYGVGDGSTTFNVPDLRQRFPLGKADSGTGATLGGTGGTIDHVHNLDVAGAYARITIDTGAAERLSIDSVPASPAWTSDRGNTGSTAAETLSRTTGTGLSGDTGTGNPPFQTVNWVIKT